MADISTPEGIESTNKVWWDKHSPDYPFIVTTILEVNATNINVSTTYGPFIACPQPISECTLWGFKREEGAKQFQADYEAGKVAIGPPRGRMDRPGAAPARPVPLPAPVVYDDAATTMRTSTGAKPEPDDFDILGDEPAVPVEDDFDILGDDDDFDIVGDDPPAATNDDPELDDDGFPI